MNIDVVVGPTFAEVVVYMNVVVKLTQDIVGVTIVYTNVVVELTYDIIGVTVVGTYMVVELTYDIVGVTVTRYGHLHGRRWNKLDHCQRRTTNTKVTSRGDDISIRCHDGRDVRRVVGWKRIKNERTVENRKHVLM